jgi:hypothetical protein
MLDEKARTGSAVGDAAGLALCSSRKSDERQVTTMSDGFEIQVKRSARLALDQGMRQSAWRGSGPTGSWLKARRAASGTAPEVNFVGCGALQGGMRTVGVIPGNEKLKFMLEGAAQQRDNGQHASAAILESSDEPFDHRDAARLADGAFAMANAVPLTPRLDGKSCIA